MKILYSLQQLLEPHPFLYSAAVALVLLLAASLISFVIRLLLICGLRKLFRFLPEAESAEYPVCVRVITNAVNILPVAFLAAAVPMIPGIAEIPAELLHNTAVAFIILFVALTISNAIDLANIFYNRRAAIRPIKGYLQLLKICLGCVAFILIVATLINKNPLYLLSGLGAMAAIIILVFQDTLLSVVASIQLTSDDMIRLGDWIEMPSQNTDGNVVEIALHTVKVRNWDNTISTVPVRKLITDSFKNWRGMVEAGGRRIKRSILLDQKSIHFLTEQEKEDLKKIALLKEYLERKEEEISAWNKNLLECSPHPVEERHLTNIGTFRAYLVNYLQNNPQINLDMTLLVRQLPPGATGIPLEIYCFTKTVEWNQYEDIQSDIFDHTLAILPKFGLRVFQEVIVKNSDLLQ